MPAARASSARCQRTRRSTVSSGSRRAQKRRRRSLPATLAGRPVTCLSQLCDKLCRTRLQQVQRGRRSRAARTVSRSPGRLKSAAELAARARSRAGRRARPASPPSRRPGPAMPVTATARSAPSRVAGTARHRRRRLGRDRAVLAQHSRRNAELGLPSPRPRTRRSRRGTRRSSPGPTVSRAATSPPVQDSAVASVSPRSRQSSSTSSSIGVSRRARRGTPRPARRTPARARRRAPRAPGLDEQVDVDLEVARADRHLDPVPVSARARERLGDRRLAEAEEPQHAPLWRACAAEQPAQRLRLEHARPELLQLSGRPGKRHRDAAAEVEHERRRRSGEPGEDRALGHDRLLAHPVRELGVGTTQPLGHGARACLDPGLERRVQL